MTFSATHWESASNLRNRAICSALSAFAGRFPAGGGGGSRQAALSFLCCLGLALILLFSADGMDAGEFPGEQAIEEIVVTGSHIRRDQQRDLASPLQSLSSDEIAEQGAKDIPDIIRNLTVSTGAEYQVSGLNQPQTAGTSNINLRGLGLSSTLVLINGRRQTLSSIAKQDDGSSFVDTNSLVPMIMIEKIDILKDGAAATYGTDAVAGVVNFITHKKFEGFKTELSYQGDGHDDLSIGAMFGGAGGASNFVIGVSYQDRNILEAGERDWPSGTALSSLGQPGAFRLSSGDFMADPACGTGGTFPRFGGTFCGMDITPFFDLMPEESRLNVAANLSHEFNASLSAYIEFSYAANEGETRATPSYPILRNFPQIPSTDPNNPFGEQVMFFGRTIGPDGAPTLLTFDYETWRVAGELTGDLWEWSWNLSATYSTNEADVGNGDTVISRLQAGLAGTGGPNGNEFYSPFGQAANSAGLIAHLQEDSLQAGDSSLLTVELITSGEMFDLPAGAVSAALGAQYRSEDLQVDLDDILNADDFYTLPGGADFSADRDVFAFFGELIVPLHTALELQLSARYEDYGDNVDSVDPKVAVLWVPVSWFSMRGSFGTSFRAPSLLQTNGRLGANDVVNDPATNLNSLFRTISTSGNPNLKPEQADVLNFGITLSPMESLEINLDWWSFDYTDLIVKESAQSLINQAFADTTAGMTGTAAQRKVVRVGNFITQINSEFINASSMESDGIDFQIRYGMDTFLGQLEFGSEWTYVSGFEIQESASSAIIEAAGSRNSSNFARPVPELRGNISVGWQNEKQSAYLVARYIDSYKDDASANAKISSHTTVDLSYSYSFGNVLGGSAETKVTLGAINLFDRDPPAVSTFIGFDVQTHDPRGRLLYAKLSHSF